MDILRGTRHAIGLAVSVKKHFGAHPEPAVARNFGTQLQFQVVGFSARQRFVQAFAAQRNSVGMHDGAMTRLTGRQFVWRIAQHSVVVG